MSVVQLLFALAFLVAVALTTYLLCRPDAEEKLLGKRGRGGKQNDKVDSSWVRTRYSAPMCIVCVLIVLIVSLFVRYSRMMNSWFKEILALGTKEIKPIVRINGRNNQMDEQ